MISPSLTDLSDALTVMDMRAEWERCERLEGTSCQVAKLQWVEKWARPVIAQIENADVQEADCDRLEKEITTLERRVMQFVGAIEAASTLLDEIDIPAARDKIDRAITILEEAI